MGKSNDNNQIDYTRISIYDKNSGTYYNGTDFSANTEAWIMTTGTTHWSIEAPTWTHGHNYTIRSRAMDTAGNEEHTDSITFEYDTINGKDSSIYVSNNAYQNNSDYTIYYTTSTNVPTNGYIEVDFPEEYRLSPWMVDTDIELSDTANEITASSDLINRSSKTITSTVTAGSVSSGSIIDLEISNLRIHNPNLEGDYDLTINLYDNLDVLLETGTGTITIVKPYQQIDLNASVEQSLQLSTNSGTVNIEVDPDVQQGQNWIGTGGTVSNYSDLEVKTNAANGYVIQIKLSGNTATGSAVLDGSGTTSNQIASTSGARLTNENNFSFALNNSGSTSTELFSNTSTNIAGASLGTATNLDINTVSYYLNVDHTTPSDVYKGMVTYTAIGAF